MVDNKNAPELEKFVKSLSDEQRPVVEALLRSIAVQAELIDDMVWRLSDQEGFKALSKKALSGVSLNVLSARLSKPVLGPTPDEIAAAVDDMQSRIKSAKDAQDAFATILTFAVKLAPLALA